MEPPNENDQAQLDVLMSLVKDAIARITELEIRVAELEAQGGERTERLDVGERTSNLDDEITRLRSEVINPS